MTSLLLIWKIYSPEFGQRFLCAGLNGIHIRLRDDVIFPQEGKLYLILFEAHDLLAKMGCHARWILPLPDLVQQVEVMDIECEKAGVLGMLSVGSILRPLDDSRAMACLDLCQIPLNGGTDTIFGEQRVPSAGIHETLLPAQAKTQTIPVAYLIAHMLHEQEKMSEIVCVLGGRPQIRFQHGAKGRLSFGLPKPLDITDCFRRLSCHDNGQSMLPAQPI